MCLQFELNAALDNSYYLVVRYFLFFFCFCKHYIQFVHYGSSSLEAQGVAQGLKARQKRFAIEATNCH